MQRHPSHRTYSRYASSATVVSTHYVVEPGFDGCEILDPIGLFRCMDEGAIELHGGDAVRVSCGFEIREELPSSRIVEHVMGKSISRYGVPTRSAREGDLTRLGMTVIHIHREGTDYQVVCTTARTGVEVPIPCRTRDELVSVLRALGVDHAELAGVFNQLEGSTDAEVRV